MFTVDTISEKEKRKLSWEKLVGKLREFEGCTIQSKIQPNQVVKHNSFDK
jgi:hypothetical protein